MHVTFHGAAREVTGSFHTLTTETDTILMDCGLFQGRRKEAEAKNKVLAVDPQGITNCILSHAHIDHSGRIPMLVDRGYTGKIFCTRATASATEYLLQDSAKIQEGDAAYLNYKTVRNFLYRMKSEEGKRELSNRDQAEIKSLLKNGAEHLRTEAIEKLIRQYHLEKITPLYTLAAVENSLSFFEGIPYRQPVTVGKDITCTFYDAGHILGSAISILTINSGGKSYNIFFSGDIGRFNKPIIQDPTLDFREEHRQIDLMIMESTYGDRLHEPTKDMKPMLKQVLQETFARGGSILIPAFAYGRTQELIYILHELYMEGAVKRVPIYVDSPLATNITHVFGQHPETYDEETKAKFLKNGINPFAFEHLKFIQTVEESMALNRDQRSHIVLSGSGMCEGGRILHHLRHKIHDDRHTVLIVGYMGSNTFGHHLQKVSAEYEEAGRKGAPPTVRFFNKDYPLRARVVTLGGFSAHGDRDELTRLIQESNLSIKKIALVHGEEQQSTAFKQHLEQMGHQVVIPYQGQAIPIV